MGSSATGGQFVLSVEPNDLQVEVEGKEKFLCSAASTL